MKMVIRGPSGVNVRMPSVIVEGAVACIGIGYAAIGGNIIVLISICFYRKEAYLRTCLRL